MPCADYSPSSRCWTTWPTLRDALGSTACRKVWVSWATSACVARSAGAAWGSSTKPANLLLDPAGHLWVADFGLARFRAAPALSASGDVVGTLRYMSPEQALAKRALVDHRSDVYALGATLYEALTLEPAFPAADR